MKNTAIIILAAGKSTRMKSHKPKVLHPVCGRPMIGYILDLVKALRVNDTVAVLGYKHETVAKELASGVKVALQKKLIGTADAVKQAMPLVKGSSNTVLVLYGDTPLLKKETITKLLKYHISNKSDATLLTAQLDKPAGYGRVIRDKYFSVSGIVEDKDADDFQKDIKEINTGIICFSKKSLVSALKRIRANNRKKEYYLTDAISIIYKSGGLVEAVKLDDINEAMGINSRVDLAQANSVMQARINESLMLSGVSIVDPKSAFINFGTKIGQDSVIFPFTVIERDVKIGKRCSIGPFIHLREATVLGDDVLAGNFLEIVRSHVGAKTLIKHFSYLGDARVGESVNIGAGSVTANFDGKKKNLTLIKDSAFIGSDTVIVAPAKIGKGAVTGAGSVITKNKFVADGTIVAGVPARPIKK
jgi:bifunctional UDP-N-acetylglucosamine pyrophosphorylase / glucosamine-1-phosphate N-acetyltransferase